MKGDSFMGNNREGDFEQSMEQLIKLLKKIMKHHPDPNQISRLQSLFRDKGININLCFFNFFPVTEEEMDEIEDLCDPFFQDDLRKSEEMTTDLSADDLEFLRRHGIRF